MASGPLIAAQAQTTTTTTGTGPLTIVNSVPAGAPAGATTFAAAFAPTAVFPVPNIFYTIIDASGNIEAGYGTLTSATVLTRDFVVFAGTANLVAPYVPALLSTPSGSFINLAAGTANVYSNPGLLSQVTPYQQRFPNFTGNSQSSAQDGGITEDIMSGTFVGSLTNGGVATNVNVRYKLSSAGIVTLFFPSGATNATAGTTSVMTGIPSWLTNITGPINQICNVISNSVVVLGNAVITAGATPTATGTITLQQSTGTSPIAYSGTFTTTVANGFPVSSLTYALG